MKSDGSGGLAGWFHQAADGFEESGDFFVVFFEAAFTRLLVRSGSATRGQAEEPRDFSLRRPTSSQEANWEERRRPAPFEMTVRRGAGRKSGGRLRDGAGRRGFRWR